MAKNKDDLKSLSQIFRDDVKFVIPDYQRGYSWEDKQREALWEDLENMPGNGYHYTGMFTFCEEVNNNENEHIYSIVDGQQRMTTLIVLINELLLRINELIDDYTDKDSCIEKYLYRRPKRAISSNLKYRFQYSSDNPSDAFFKTKILGLQFSQAYLQPDTLYTRNLQDAKGFFAEKIKDYNQEQLIDLFKKVTERLKFNEYLIDDLNEVYVTFETMNNRGKNLSTLELLKNRLIYLSTLYPPLASGKPDEQIVRSNAESLRDNINNTWKNIYACLGGSSKKKLSDDAFLRDHWIMYFRYDRKTSMVYKEDLLSKTFIAKRVLNNELKIDEIDKYVTNLGESVVCWFNINCPMESSLPDNEKMWLTRLNHVGIGSFRPLLMAIYIKRASSDNIEELLKACEKFRFLVFNVSGRRSNTADYHYYGLANEFFRTTNKSTADVLKDISEVTIKWFDINNFINSAIDRYKNREGFYSWSGLRYFLYEYERELQPKGEDKKVLWDSFENNQKNKVSIEHIYPQTPSDDYWTSRFITKEEQALTHSLGNLLLLSRSKNSEQQNYSFDIKKKTIRNEKGGIEHRGYDEGSYSEINVAKKNQWTPLEIIDRGKTLLDFLNRHWEIKHAFTDEELCKLLNISSQTYTPADARQTDDNPDWADPQIENDDI